MIAFDKKMKKRLDQLDLLCRIMYYVAKLTHGKMKLSRQAITRSSLLFLKLLAIIIIIIITGWLIQPLDFITRRSYSSMRCFHGALFIIFMSNPTPIDVPSVTNSSLIVSGLILQGVLRVT